MDINENSITCWTQRRSTHQIISYLIYKINELENRMTAVDGISLPVDPELDPMESDVPDYSQMFSDMSGDDNGNA